MMGALSFLDATMKNGISNNDFLGSAVLSKGKEKERKREGKEREREVAGRREV